jgi:hypothetical protein
MHLTASFKTPKVDFAKFRQALHDQLAETLAQAGMKYLMATAETLPTWSGASRATFTPLASHVGFVLSIAPVAISRIDLGAELGNATFDAGETDPSLYTFSYETTLPHLIVNEYHNTNTFINPANGKPYFHLKNPGPYHFQSKGEKAFRDFASEVVLPGWGSILDWVQITVN